MSAEPDTASAAAAGTAKDHAPRDARGAGLLVLVRQLIGFGQAVVCSLRGRNATLPPFDVVRRFGCVNVALIIARITRGIMIAQALEARLMRRTPRDIMPPVRIAIPAGSPRPAQRRPRRTDDQDDAELLGALPSAREIAERIRRRPAGAVIVEICRDLGITTEHPLWRTINMAIIRHGGSLVRMLHHWTRQSMGLAEVIGLPHPADPPGSPATTHPP